MKAWIQRLLNRNAEPAHLKTGRWGEQQAVQRLKSGKYRILGQRVRAGVRDEIDIIAQDGDTLVFVEVKTRGSELYGRPSAAVNARKRKCLSRAAVAHMKRHRLQPSFIRFDVMEVVGNAQDGPPEIRHIQNAFPLDSAYRLWW